MAEEKKQDSQGPVVIRKGHVKPPPPGAKIEAPQVESLSPPPKKDDRPLWQRVAESKGAAPAPGAPAPRGAGPRRGPPRERPGPGGERHERGPRRERDDRSGAPRAAEGDRPPATPEPPPAPEAPVVDEGSFADML